MADIPDSHRDLLDAQVATLATVDAGLPVCSVLILDLANPYRHLVPRGDYVFADRVGEKYDADLRHHDRPGESRVVVTIDVAKAHAVDMSGA